MLLTKEQILSADDLSAEVVSVPEWGGDVRVRVMTGLERDTFEQSIMSKKGKNSEINFVNLRAKLVALVVVDAEGKRIFEEADIPALGKKSAMALDRIFEVAQRINGIGKKEVDELTKNSEADQNA